MSSLKFSYWSSPQTRTTSGLKSSRILRIARKSLPKRSPQRLGAPRPSSLPSSASISFGQLAGSLRAGSTLGASSVRLKTPVSPSLGRHKVGQWVTPRPRISAIVLFLSLVLPARLEAEGVLTVHRADRVPIEADVPRHGVGVAPGALHRVRQQEPVAAGRRVERFDRLHREPGDISLVAAAADAVGDGDLLAGMELRGHVAHVGEE